MARVATAPLPSPRRRADEAAELLAAASAFRLVAQAFATPRPGRAAELRAAIFRMTKAERHLAPAVARAWREFRRTWLVASPAELVSEYMRLFLGRVTVSLHETAYGDGRRVGGRPVELADINGYYRAFGFTMRDTDPDLPDHVAVVSEFASLMLIKESYALANGWSGPWRLTRGAIAGFHRDHLGRWLDGLLRDLRQEQAPAAYVAAARLLIALVREECRRLDVRPQAADARMPLDSTIEDDEFICPHAANPPGQD